MRIERASTSPTFKSGKLSFTINLAPGASWHACLAFLPLIEGRTLHPPRCGSFFEASSDYDRKRDLFLEEATHFTAPAQETLTSVVLKSLAQAQRDLAALRLYDYDVNEHAWTVAAGLPVYTGLFGRDVLITGWQAALASPALLLGALSTLPQSQATTTNDWRDAQPGRLIHQIQDSPLAVLNYNPFRVYYGCLSAPVFYCEVVFALWLWVGDKALVLNQA